MKYKVVEVVVYLVEADSEEGAIEEIVQSESRDKDFFLEVADRFAYDAEEIRNLESLS